MTLEEAQLLIGQRVTVKDSKGVEIGGVLQRVGRSEFFESWGMTCTIDRMPVTNIDLNTLQKQVPPTTVKSC